MESLKDYQIREGRAMVVGHLGKDRAVAIERAVNHLETNRVAIINAWEQSNLIKIDEKLYELRYQNKAQSSHMGFMLAEMMLNVRFIYTIPLWSKETATSKSRYS